MIGLLIRVTLAILVLNQLLMPCLAYGSNRGRGSYGSGKYNSKPNKEAASKTYMGTSSSIESQPATRRGLGISAWGIVALIVSLILAGMGFYYFSMCYPILCKRERKYDMMELPNVA